MENRSPASVFFLGIFTAGLYHFIWLVKTKGEMNARGADIPTAWMLILPIVNLIWIWKYCQGVAKVTNGGTSAVMTLLLFLLAGPFGPSILQSQFNKVGAAAVPAAPAPVPSAPAAAPAASTPPPPAPAEEPATAEEEPAAVEEEPAAAEEQESADDDEEKSET